MKIKSEFWLILGIVTFVLWTIAVSIAIVDLYAIQESILNGQDILIKCMDTVQEILLEIDWGY